MAHFAKLDENNNVVSVHSVHDKHLLKNGVENEEVGINFLTNVHGWSNWKQTSYHTRRGKYLNNDGTVADDQNKMLRYNYASNGSTYDAARNAFILPRPADKDGVTCDSWTINENTMDWEAPVPEPSTQTNGVDDLYHWNEGTQSWDKEVVWRVEGYIDPLNK
tara:strand:- start:199 stop:687 length:489 start_codon:yes stop_codon:yes gene_type:complete